MAKTVKSVSRARATRKTPKTVTLNLPITPRLLRAIEARAEYDVASAALDKAEAPLWAEYRKLSRKKQDEQGFPTTPAIDALRAKRKAVDDRLQALCKPMRAEILGRPLPPHRILEATLAGWYDLSSTHQVVMTLSALAIEVINQGQKGRRRAAA